MNHLNYEFYFLFQVTCNNANETWQEPLSFPNRIVQDNLHSLRIDKDKRLFRYAPPSNKAKLSEWQQHLQQGWKQITACYQDAFLPEAFMGVALLIMNETVKEYKVSCNTNIGKVTFQPATDNKTPNEKFLLKIASNELREIPPATLEEFEPEYQPTTNCYNWQIKISSSQPLNLAPMELGENHHNPIFAVYGLAHGHLPSTAANQLQNFLCSGDVALMWQVLTRLIMQKWQFERLDIAASELRQQLDSKNEIYQQIPDDNLKCANDKKFEKELHDTMQLDANAKQVLARLDAATKTLEINRYNLERNLHRSEQVWQYLDKTDKTHNWELTWQNDTEVPLLDSFDLNINNLKNHTTYIQAALAYLDGIRTRWQLHLDGQRLQYESNIQKMLFVLTFIAAFTGVVAFITQNPEDVAILLGIFTDNPQRITQIGHLLLIGINLLILIFFILPFAYLYLKSLGKKFHCWLKNYFEL
ncbi:hypothetical protein QUF74_14400 [Candidatus Halobeggiatoa sp. HSG11]|nr:hypothetical protein [Candidatus Halobeggiatoa sp. HSG11]